MLSAPVNELFSSNQFISHPRSEGWPHRGRTSPLISVICHSLMWGLATSWTYFSIDLCHLSFLDVRVGHIVDVLLHWSLSFVIPWSEGWPHRGRTSPLISVVCHSLMWGLATSWTYFSIDLCHLSFWFTGIFRGHWAMAPKDFLAPKCRLKKCLTGYYCYLILGKITKFVATKCQILRLKCTKFNFGYGCAPEPAEGSLQRSPKLPSWIYGAYF